MQVENTNFVAKLSAIMYNKLSIIKSISQIGSTNIQHAHGSLEFSVCCASLVQH